jgi:hypothetical protein
MNPFLRKLFVATLVLINITQAHAQIQDTCVISNEVADALYIKEVQDAFPRDKVLHAEPLFIDLIRDLGARKGESEWNIGAGINDRLRDDHYEYLIEYEWAPIDRLGLEVELPFTVYPSRIDGGQSRTGTSKINSLKLAAQYSFFVSEELKTSLALGYIHEFNLVPFHLYGKGSLFNGNTYKPFLVAAKRWGNNFHTLYYGGPEIYVAPNARSTQFEFAHNLSLHFMIPGTRNFIGLEMNQLQETHGSRLTLRPQMRISLADNLMIGVVAGIPARKGEERLSSFFRLIYEPNHKHK